ncbi:hypothetical protein IJD44_02520 [bacterium]|nr:hypothetical protein [bacterium]
MAEMTGKREFSSPFSLEKIPVNKQNEGSFDVENNKFADKVKLLELSNYIDEWEREILFSKNGFFSLKGKYVENKSKEYIAELERFINAKTSNIVFCLENSKKAAKELKRIKIENIKSQLLKHEQKELYDWEIDVYNKALQAAQDKAILYKYDFDIVFKSVKNGIKILSLISEREKWTDKIFKIKQKKFVSSCCFEIIQSFIKEKDIDFLRHFNTYSRYLLDEDKEKLEELMSELKDNIIAYNWATELFSYDLNDEENEKEIKRLNDKNLEPLVRSYIDVFKKLKKKNNEELKQLELQQTWDKIDSLLKTEPEKALLYVDIEKDKESTKAQKEYITKLIGEGYIITDKAIFCELFSEMLNDFASFKYKLLSKYKHKLSQVDFELLKNLQKQSDTEYLKIISDYKFLFQKLKEMKIEAPNEIYDFILDYRLAIDDYKLINSKSADFEKKNKIIEILLARISHKKSEKKEEEN